MLQQIRERIQGVVAGVIVFLLVLTFALFGVQYYLNDTRSEQAVAKVNGHAISATELNDAYRVFKTQVHRNTPRYDGMFGSLEFAKHVKSQLLMRLVSQLLAQQYIFSLPLGVTPEMVQASLAQNPQFQLNGAFSKRLYDNYLQAHGLTEDQELNNEELRIQFSQWQQGVAGTAFVLPNELKQAVNHAYEKREVGYLQIDAGHLSTPKVTAKAVNAYYRSNKAKYQQAERVKVAYVRLDEKALQKKVHISEANVKQYYKQNKDRFFHPAVRQVTQVLWPVADDADAAAWEKAEGFMQAFQEGWRQKASKAWLKQWLAKHHRAKLSATIWHGKDSIPKAIAQQALKAGTITAPLRDAAGIVVYQINAVQPAEQQSLKAVSATIRTSLASHRMADLFAEMSDQMSELAYTHPNTLETVSDALSLPVQHSGWIQKQAKAASNWSATRPHPGLFDRPSVQQLIFSHDVLDLKNNSSLIKDRDGSVMVLRVVAHERERAKPLDRSLRKQIKADIVLQQQRKALWREAKQVVSALQKGESGTKVAKRYGYHWQQLQLNQQSKGSARTELMARQVFAIHGNPSIRPMLTAFPVGRESLLVCQVLAIHAGQHISDEQREKLMARVQVEQSQLSLVNTLEPFIQDSKIKIEKH